MIRTIFIQILLAASLACTAGAAPATNDAALPSSSGYLHSSNPSDEEEFELLEMIVNGSQAEDYDALLLANDLLGKLSTHFFGKKHYQQLQEFRSQLMEKFNVCLLSNYYFIEKEGINLQCLDESSQTPETMHLYGSGDVKGFINRWYAHSGEESFEGYIANYTTVEEKQFLHKYWVHYLDPHDSSAMAPYEVGFDNKNITIGGATPDDGDYIFVIDYSGTKMFAGKKTRTPYYRFHHSSFLASQPVKCAGVFRIEKGEFVFISLSSGHYKPKSQHGENVRAFLLQVGYLDAEAAAALQFSPH